MEEILHFVQNDSERVIKKNDSERVTKKCIRNY